MYPYDNDEFDEEERALNTQIKVLTSSSNVILILEQNSLRRRWF
jgi:hypothetical protein